MEPCPNCFVCFTNNEQDKEKLFWLTYGLWQGKVFRGHLMGTAVQYIRKKDVQNVLLFGIEKLKQDPLKAQKNILAVTKIEQQKSNITKQIQLMNELKQVLIMQLLR